MKTCRKGYMAGNYTHLFVSDQHDGCIVMPLPPRMARTDREKFYGKIMKTIALWFLIFVSFLGLGIVAYCAVEMFVFFLNKGVPLWAFIVTYAVIASAVFTFIFRKF